MIVSEKEELIMKIECLGSIFEVAHVDGKGNILTECGYFFNKGEYKILPGVNK